MTNNDVDRALTRLEILKTLASVHHSEMIKLQDQETLTENEEISLNRHISCFNSLSSAIGLAQSVGRWRKFEAVPNKMKGITPLQKAVFRVHYSLVKKREEDD
jgi:hypothetical protein